MSSNDLDFSGLPPFPSDIPTAPLLRLSLQKLLDGEQDELSRLWKACCNLGFFYLDIRDAKGSFPSPGGTPAVDSDRLQTTSNGSGGFKFDGNTFLEDAYNLFDVAEEFYRLPKDEKVKYDLKDRGSYHGYKGYGAGVIDKEGTPDRVEFYNFSKDDILGLSSPLPGPKVFEPHRPLIASYMTSAHTIITLILTRLNTLLHLPPDTLTSLHALHSPSGDQTRLVRSPPQPAQDRTTALGAHTDFGSVTLLFNRLGGLQILPPETDGMSEGEKNAHWLWVRPLRGHCVVNFGDAMVKFTRGILRSNVHRVVNPPGEEQGAMTRLSLVYFARAADEVLLKALEGSDVIDARKGVWEDDGKVMSSKEWVLARALGRRTGKWVAGTEGSRGNEIRAGKTLKSEIREVEANCRGHD